MSVAQSTPPNACWFCAVPGLALVEVAGADAIKVLNGLCTAKLTDLANDSAVEAFFTDDRGRVLEHGMVARNAIGLTIVGQFGDAGKLTAHIDRFIFRESATPRDITGQWQGWLLTGSASQLQSVIGLPHEELPNAAWTTSNLAGVDCKWLHWSGLDQTTSRATSSEEALSDQRHWLCLVPRASADVVRDALIAQGFALQSEDDWERMRIAAFWPQSGKEILQRTLPQELARDALAISFTKGCYLGQETVARLDAMGQVQKKLCLVEIDGSQPVPGGTPLQRDEKEVGQVTSAAPAGQGDRSIALAYMRRGNFDAGTAFVTRANEGSARSGRVLPSPVFRPAG